jgi:hypothetical protein
VESTTCVIVPWNVMWQMCPNCHQFRILDGFWKIWFVSFIVQFKCHRLLNKAAALLLSNLCFCNTHDKMTNTIVVYNPPSSSIGLHVFYLRESKCFKWWKRNFINNSTLSLLLFILFHNCWNLHKCRMYGCAFENVSLLALVSSTQLVTSKVWNRLLPYVRFSKLVKFQIHPPLNILTLSRLAKL